MIESRDGRKGGAEPSSSLPPEVLQEIIAALSGLRYGAVEVTVHESRVVQVERREKFRFGSSSGLRP